MRFLLPLIFVGLVSGMPMTAFAADANFFGPIIPEECHCEGTAPEWGCALQVIQNLMNFGISLGVIMFVLAIAVTGLTFIMSPISAKGRETGKNMMKSAVIGLVIMLMSWLLVDFVMKVLYHPEEGDFGPWKAILEGNEDSYCLDAKNPSSVAPRPGGSDTNGGIVSVPRDSEPGSGGGTSFASRICSAANSYRDTSTTVGPDGGRKACAWAVNNILDNANIDNIGSVNVAGMERELQGGRGTQVSASSAVCGDIVIEAGKAHVGICLNSGCTQVISNSSSRARFSWISGPTFQPSYSSGTGRIYRVNN